MASPFFPDVIIAWKAAPFIDGTEIPANEFLEAAQKFLPIFGLYGYAYKFEMVPAS